MYNITSGANFALILTNYVDSQHDDPDDKPVPEKWFHLVEFWGTFAFAIVECLSLTNTPKSMINIYDNPHLLRLILFFNIVVATIPAVLISFNYEYFEVVSVSVLDYARLSCTAHCSNTSSATLTRTIETTYSAPDRVPQ